MELTTIKIFVSGQGLSELTEKEFIENLRLGQYDGLNIEILETKGE